MRRGQYDAAAWSKKRSPLIEMICRILEMLQQCKSNDGIKSPTFRERSSELVFWIGLASQLDRLNIVVISEISVLFSERGERSASAPDIKCVAAQPRPSLGYPRHLTLFNHRNVVTAMRIGGLETERVSGAYAWWAISLANSLFKESARRGRGVMHTALSVMFLPLDLAINLFRPHGSMTIKARRPSN